MKLLSDRETAIVIGYLSPVSYLANYSGYLVHNKPDEVANFLCVFVRCFGLDFAKKHNSCSILTEELTNGSVSIT